MGEGEPDIPDLEKFSSRKEEKDFSAIHYDPNVRRAMDTMEQHLDTLEGEPSPIERLIEELDAEWKKSSPDSAKLDDIRHRLADAHALLEAQTLTPENEAQHRRDRLESEVLNQREEVVGKIMKTATMVGGLERDIAAMADEAIGEMAEKYPEPMAKILNQVATIRTRAFDEVREMLDKPDPDAAGTLPPSLQSSQTLLAAKDTALTKTLGLLLTARNQMIDEQSKMLKAVSEWRKKHQTK